MSWWAWILLAAGLITVFVLWDLIFCGGRRCRHYSQILPRDFDLSPSFQVVNADALRYRDVLDTEPAVEIPPERDPCGEALLDRAPATAKVFP